MSLILRRVARRAAGLAPRAGAVAPSLAPGAAGAPIRWHGGAGTFDAGAEDVRVVFVAGDGTETEVVAKAGQDLLDIAHRNDIDMEGACEGSIACSTCHVILDDDVFDQLEEATEEEDDMLDMAPGLTDTSRLGCQVVVTSDLDGIRVQLPKQTRNFYVDGHKPTPH
ncbi:hypothetical protein FNF31_07240 [Cafeteria roenbergensis]|nr:hypothetical protein FNF31_07240 [Cafeteria roenbergensis]